jgi:tRNA(fMet)-specific endonuclease VapC
VTGYLMDTNHVTAWEADNPNLLAKIQSLPRNTLIYTSAITLGEISAGHEMTSGDAHRRHVVKQFLNIYVIPYTLPISYSAEFYYGQIMGRLWKRTSPPKANISTDSHLVNTLGINVNDVWIVASASEHGLILLTTDSMTAIKTVTPEVRFENWCL